MSKPLKYQLVKAGDVFSTDNYGDCKVTAVTGRGTTGDKATIKFFDTGNTRDIRIGILRSGAVLDKYSPLYKQPGKLHKYPLPKVGDIFSTNSGGDCEVIAFDGNGMSKNIITVKFVNTDYVATCRHSELRQGKVRNRNNPSVFGVGYLGDGIHKASDPAYDLWYAVMQRCYNSNYYNKHTESSYSDVEVCKEWHNYQNFADFYISNYVDDYQLDKDLLNPGSKVYSPDNCLFVSRAINNVEAALRKLASEDTSYIHLLEAFRLQAIT